MTYTPQPIIACYGFRPGPGGIPNVLLHLMNGLAARGAALDLLLETFDIPELDRLRPEIRRIDLNQLRGPGTSVRIARYVREQRPHTLFCQRERATRQALYARTLARVPVRVVVRVGTHNSVSLRQRNWFQRFLRRRALIFGYRRADAIVAVSRGVAADLAGLGRLPAERIVTLNNPTVPDDFRNRAACAVAHPWLQPGTLPVVMALGRLARVKDYPTLLRAFARIQEAVPSRLMILGEGKKREELLQLAAQLQIADRMELPGFVANPFSYLSKAALFVLSSRREGSPNALIEALAVGTPVVATDCPSGPREILADGRYGELVPVGDSEALAAAMTATLRQPPPADHLFQAARPYVVAESVVRYWEVLLAP